METIPLQENGYLIKSSMILYMELLEIIETQLDKERNSPFLADLNFESIVAAQKIQPSKRPDGMSEMLVDLLLLRLNKVTSISRYTGKVPRNREEYDQAVEQIRKASPFSGEKQ